MHRDLPLWTIFSFPFCIMYRLTISWDSSGLSPPVADVLVGDVPQVHRCVGGSPGTKTGLGRGPSSYFQDLLSMDHPAGGKWLWESWAPHSGTLEFSNLTAVKDRHVALESDQLTGLKFSIIKPHAQSSADELCPQSPKAGYLSICTFQP